MVVIEPEMSRGKAHAGARLSRRARTSAKPPSTGRRRSAHSGAGSDRKPGQMTNASTPGGNTAVPGTVSMTAAEATVAALFAHGLDTIYALPGVHNDVLFDALFKAADRIRTVHTRHEQGARSEEHTSELQSPDHLVCR